MGASGIFRPLLRTVFRRVGKGVVFHAVPTRLLILRSTIGPTRGHGAHRSSASLMTEDRTPLPILPQL